jgi:hypothetical protein
MGSISHVLSVDDVAEVESNIDANNKMDFLSDLKLLNIRSVHKGAKLLEQNTFRPFASLH